MKTCVIEWCRRDRVPASLYCKEHLTDLWHNRPVVVEERQKPEWLRRLAPKDMTRSAA